MKQATRAHTVPKFYLSGFLDPSTNGIEGPYLWLGSIADGRVSCKSPKNVSVLNRYYDGPGGFEGQDITLEKHLAGIESAAARAIKEFVQLEPKIVASMPPEIARFLAWQAARTPGWFELEQAWANDAEIRKQAHTIEPPPQGLEKVRDGHRLMTIQNPKTGAEISIPSENLNSYLDDGWKWVLSKQDRLELMHVQAWYFQVRHFPRLNWTRLTAPVSDFFITSDRAVAWLADGYANTPPAALRHPTAEAFAPLTRVAALVGRNAKGIVGMTARELNLKVAFSASKWIAGPTQEVVQQALSDRQIFQKKFLYTAFTP